MHITEVRSNVKGASAVVPLHEKTLLLGPSKSGKSRIVNIIELALTGRVSDIAGKDRSIAADLLALAPGRQGKLWAEATLSDGTTASWSTESNGPGKAKTPTHNLPSTIDKAKVLPLRALAEAIGGKPDKARRFFLGAATGQVTVADVLGRIPDNLHPAFAEHEPDADTFAANPTGVLLTVRDAAHRAHLDGKNTSKALETTLGNLQGSQAIKPTEAQLAAAKDQVAATQRTLESAIRYDASAANVERYAAAVAARDAMPPLQEAVTHAREALATLQQQLNDTQLDQGTQDRAMRGSSLLMLADWQLAKDTKACALCSNPTTMDQLRGQHGRLKDAVRGVAELSASRLQQQQVIATSINEWKAYSSEVHAQLLALRQTAANSGEAPETAVQTVSLADARELNRVATTELAAMVRAADAWEGVDRVRTEALQAAETRDQAARLRDACQTAADELLASSVAAFSAKVQTYLPDGETFAMRLHEGKREVFQLGLLKDDIIHTALSGAEWAEVTAAVAAALVDDAQLVVIIPEERAYDAQTLRAVMVALAKVPGQVILTSVLKPAGRKPAGWHIVDVGAVESLPPRMPAVTPPSDNGVDALSL